MRFGDASVHMEMLVLDYDLTGPSLLFLLLGLDHLTLHALARDKDSLECGWLCESLMRMLDFSHEDRLAFVLGTEYLSLESPLSIVSLLVVRVGQLV